MRRLLLIFLLAAATQAAEDYFPLATGNVWAYRNERGGTWTIRVGEPVEAGGRTYFQVEGYGASNLLLRKDETGNLVRWDDSTRDESVVTRFEGTFASGAGFCREEGAVSREPGRFSNSGQTLKTLDIRYRILGCADAGIESESYSANLGLVRRVTQSLIGPVEYELVRARIGGIAFGASASASVSVTLSRPELRLPPLGQPLGIRGSITVDVPGPEPLDLGFSSAQRFNVTLASKDGELLWTWSADKLFAAVTAKESWTGSRAFEWELVIPADVASRLGQDLYRVESWITSTGQRPSLAAAAPLRIGAVN
jgi:hypothetical protein